MQERTEEARTEGTKFWEITNIREYVNQTSGFVTLINHKDPNDDISIDPLNTRIEEVHVPWANNSGEFMGGGQRLEITLSAPSRKYYVWQFGEKIHYSTDGTWNPNAYAVPGYANAGGNKRLYFRPDGSLYLEMI